MNPAAKPSVSPIAPATKTNSKQEPANTSAIKAPVLKRSERLPEPALEVLANQLDAFIEAGPATNAAIVDRLRSVSHGETIKELEEATNAMRRFAVCHFFQRGGQPDVSDPALKTFARLWPKAEAQIRSERGEDQARTGIDLEFGLAFNLMIHRINGPEVSLAPRR